MFYPIKTPKVGKKVMIGMGRYKGRVGVIESKMPPWVRALQPYRVRVGGEIVCYARCELGEPNLIEGGKPADKEGKWANELS